MLPLYGPPVLTTLMVISPESSPAAVMVVLPSAPVQPGPGSSSLSPVLATKAWRSLQSGLHHSGPGLPGSRSPRPRRRHARVAMLPGVGPGRGL